MAANVMPTVTWTFQTQLDAAPPHVENETPTGAFILRTATVSFDILDEGLLSLAPASIVVRISGVLVYSSLAAQSGYTVTVTTVPFGFHFEIQSPGEWAAGTPTVVEVDGNDGINVMITFVWAFTGTTVGLEICAPLPALPVEVRLRAPLPTPGLEILRGVVINMVSTDTMLNHRIRGVLLTAHQNEFGAVFADVLSVDKAILAEKICKKTRLFTMTPRLTAIDTSFTQARRELRSMGLSQGYLDLLDARALSASPQHRVSAACATVVLAAVMLLDAGKNNVSTAARVSTGEVPLAAPVFTVVVDQSISPAVYLAAPLLTFEERLLLPFSPPGLEELRRAVLSLVSGEVLLERRARAVMLIAHQNDFGPVFADLVAVPAFILKEIVSRRRKLFAMDVDLQRFAAVWQQARRELRAAGLSQGYITLLEARATSSSPQHRVTAACATLLLGALLFALPPPIILMPNPTFLTTEGGVVLLTEAGEALEAS